MKQFDVYENPSPAAKRFAPYLVVLSSHLLTDFDDVIVAPLVNDAERAVAELEIEVEVDGERLVVVVSELSSLNRRSLKRRAISLARHEFEIRRALDRLFTGF